MNNLENPLKLLRELKGAPLSALMALSIVRQPVSANWIENITGYANETTTKALRLLVEFGYVIKISGQKWQIGSNIQLPLMIENHEKSDFNSTTTTTTRLEGSEVMEGKAAAVAAKITENRIFEMLNEVGIGEPVRSELAKRDYITEDYLKYHIKKWMDEGKSIGLLIYRLRNQDPIPNERLFAHLKYDLK